MPDAATQTSPSDWQVAIVPRGVLVPTARSDLNEVEEEVSSGRATEPAARRRGPVSPLELPDELLEQIYQELSAVVHPAARRRVELLDLPDDVLLLIFRKLHALFFHFLGLDDPAGEQVEGSRFIPPLKYIKLSRRIYALARPIWLSRLSTSRMPGQDSSLNMRHNARLWSRVDELASQVRALHSVVRLETSIEEFSLMLRFAHITHLELQLHINEYVPAFARYLLYFPELVSLQLLYWADDPVVTHEAPFGIDSQLPKLRNLSLWGKRLTNLFLTMPCTGLQVLTFDIDITALPLQIPWSSLKKLTLTGMPDPSSGATFRQSLEDIAASPSNEPAWPLSHLGLIDRHWPRYYRSMDATSALVETYHAVLSLFGSKSAFSTLEMDDTWRDMLELPAFALLAHVTSLYLGAGETPYDEKFWSDVLKFLAFCPAVKVLTIEDFRMSIVGDSLFPTKQPRRPRGRFDACFVKTPVFLVELASTKVLRFTLVAEESRSPWTKVRHDWWRASEEEKFVREA